MDVDEGFWVDKNDKRYGDVDEKNVGLRIVGVDKVNGGRCDSEPEGRGSGEWGFGLKWGGLEKKE
ncbi:hypothetical protein [Paenibacillus xylanexedens]|uniref:hypothetical protein n=1 Tax=Paenibacillus xylanexedens TaxID=528191 RepID=UPI00119EB79D|nr:hypothetical protein [Paenibacillus xylanexedens]